jgi:osmotically-inducible protein OsmY
MKRALAALFLLLALIGNNRLYGQNQDTSQSGSSQDSSTTHDSSANTHAIIDDPTITKNINSSFGDDKVFSTLGLQVQTQNGVVTLQGVLPSKVELERAITMTRGIHGVKSVNSQLTINPIPITGSDQGPEASNSETSDTNATTSTPSTDTSMNPESPSTENQPVVQGGTNAGAASTPKTNITPGNNPKIGGSTTDSIASLKKVEVSDTQLKEEIESKLDAEKDLNAKVKTKVIDGDVILRGHVKNRAAEARIVELIQSVEGVRDIHSMLILKSPS